MFWGRIAAFTSSASRAPVRLFSGHGKSPAIVEMPPTSY